MAKSKRKGMGVSSLIDAGFPELESILELPIGVVGFLIEVATYFGADWGGGLLN